MSIIWPCPLGPSSYEAAGREIAVPAQTCPSCNQELRGWGGYWRRVRSERPEGSEWPPEHHIWIRRGRCADCGRTQALLPSFLFVRRLDADPVIGSAFNRAAGGRGTRKVAQQLGLPHTTVRDWCRRVKTKAAMLLAALLKLATSLDSAPVAITADGVAAVLEALESAWQRAREHWGARIPDRWSFWSLMSGGLVLAFYTTPPLPGELAGGKVEASP